MIFLSRPPGAYCLMPCSVLMIHHYCHFLLISVHRHKLCSLFSILDGKQIIHKQYLQTVCRHFKNKVSKQFVNRVCWCGLSFTLFPFIPLYICSQSPQHIIFSSFSMCGVWKTVTCNEPVYQQNRHVCFTLKILAGYHLHVCFSFLQGNSVIHMSHFPKMYIYSNFMNKST